LLVETGDRTALFDPGSMSAAAIDVDSLQKLDDVFITHIHQDHFDINLIQKIVQKFPGIRITTTDEVVDQLSARNIPASTQAPQGVTFFVSPHESVAPLFPQPSEIGIHYEDIISHPGDSHSFKETKKVLALPITAPWGSTIRALNLALELKPQYVLPIHDWHWSEEARTQMYDMFENQLGSRGITFYKLQTGRPVDIF
jgi:L-ascorbate metabolism protein UlaG (beta-lactamase superfamily)